jgi:hypothetical protein
MIKSNRLIISKKRTSLMLVQKRGPKVIRRGDILLERDSPEASRKHIRFWTKHSDNGFPAEMNRVGPIH